MFQWTLKFVMLCIHQICDNRIATGSVVSHLEESVTSEYIPAENRLFLHRCRKIHSLSCSDNVFNKIPIVDSPWLPCHCSQYINTISVNMKSCVCSSVMWNNKNVMPFTIFLNRIYRHLIVLHIYRNYCIYSAIYSSDGTAPLMEAVLDAFV